MGTRRTRRGGVSTHEIRVARPDDAEAVESLVRAFRDHLKVSGPTDADLATGVRQALADPDLEFCCAWVSGDPVGYTQTRFSFSLWAAGLEAYLEDLFVLSTARRRSIGRALLRHAMQRAIDRGAKALALTTNERNEAAQKLYRSEGLRPDGEGIWGDGREIRWIARLGVREDRRSGGRRECARTPRDSGDPPTPG